MITPLNTHQLTGYTKIELKDVVKSALLDFMSRTLAIEINNQLERPIRLLNQSIQNIVEDELHHFIFNYSKNVTHTPSPTPKLIFSSLSWRNSFLMN